MTASATITADYPGLMGLTRKDFKEKFNACFMSGEDFFFMIDYEQNFFDVISQFHHSYHSNHQLNKHNEVSESLIDDVFFSTPRWSLPSLHHKAPPLPNRIVFEKFPIPYSEYVDQFERVMDEIYNGNTYLLNLTTETPIHTNLTLEQIYMLSQAPYRLNYRNRFLSFSPETFVTVNNGIISASPMKGTYTSREEAKAASRKMNPKELYEQTTVVDRVRNDLSRICNRVQVEEFLAVQEVVTHKGKIYQTISRVTGELSDEFLQDPAGSFLKLLPAASVSGAPRDSTVAIIHEVESHHRNFYTGVWGVVRKGYLESAVTIRYLEQRDGQLFYKSGGGITFMSEVKPEYQEMTDKVYLPFYDG